MAFLDDFVMAAPTYIIYREGEAHDATTPLAFFPAKDSDELFDALRAKFPHLKSHSERMRDAIIEFLIQERDVTVQHNASPWQQSFSGTSLSATADNSPDLANLRDPSFDSADMQRSISHGSSPPAIEDMTSVFSLSSTDQPKQRLRRKMTELEKAEYRKRRIMKACDKCAKRKRKCTHNQMTDSNIPLTRPTTGKVCKIPSIKPQVRPFSDDGALSLMDLDDFTLLPGESVLDFDNLFQPDCVTGFDAYSPSYVDPRQLLQQPTNYASSSSPDSPHLQTPAIHAELYVPHLAVSAFDQVLPVKSRTKSLQEHGSQCLGNLYGLVDMHKQQEIRPIETGFDEDCRVPSPRTVSRNALMTQPAAYWSQEDAIAYLDHLQTGSQHTGLFEESLQTSDVSFATSSQVLQSRTLPYLAMSFEWLAANRRVQAPTVLSQSPSGQGSRSRFFTVLEDEGLSTVADNSMERPSLDGNRKMAFTDTRSGQYPSRAIRNGASQTYDSHGNMPLLGKSALSLRQTRSVQSLSTPGFTDRRRICIDRSSTSIEQCPSPSGELFRLRRAAAFSKNEQISTANRSLCANPASVEPQSHAPSVDSNARTGTFRAVCIESQIGTKSGLSITRSRANSHVSRHASLLRSHRTTIPTQRYKEYKAIDRFWVRDHHGRTELSPILRALLALLLASIVLPAVSGLCSTVACYIAVVGLLPRPRCMAARLKKAAGQRHLLWRMTSVS